MIIKNYFPVKYYNIGFKVRKFSEIFELYINSNGPLWQLYGKETISSEENASIEQS